MRRKLGFHSTFVGIMVLNSVFDAIVGLFTFAVSFVFVRDNLQ